MKASLVASTALLSILISSLCFSSFQENAKEAVVVKVQPRIGSPVVGILLKETNVDLQLWDFRTGKEVTFGKADVLRVVKNLTDREVTASIGLPAFLAWRINQSLDLRTKKGKIAKVSEGQAYVSLGSRDGMKIGDKIAAFRAKGNIKGPDSGKIIGVETEKIGEFEVVEVRPEISLASLPKDLKVPPQVGDGIEIIGKETRFAILPIIDGDGNETDAGDKLREELTTSLVSRGVRVVERALLETVLSELALQQMDLFDSATAQRVGKQMGAFATLTGKIVRNARTAEAHVRVVRVDTGEILFAGSQPVSAGASQVTRPGKTPRLPKVKGNEPPRAKSGSSQDSFTNSIGNKFVSIPGKQFFVATHEVTQAQFEQIMGSNPAGLSSTGVFKDKVAGLNTRNFPVDHVSDAEAIEFCKRLSNAAKEKSVARQYRLPTQAEWEYFARGGTEGSRFFFGDQQSALSQYAWFADNSSTRPHPVGELGPNGYGLYDVYGNLWEWCSDSNGNQHVLRGGGYANRGEGCLANVWKDASDTTDNGIRLICESHR